MRSRIVLYEEAPLGELIRLSHLLIGRLLLLLYEYSASLRL